MENRWCWRVPSWNTGYHDMSIPVSAGEPFCFCFWKWDIWRCGLWAHCLSTNLRISVCSQMLAYTFFPALLFVCDPTFANVLFLPRGGIYASFDHWTLHLPIETRTSWTFANKLEYCIRLFKNKFAANFAEHRHKIRSDLADSIWGKFMIESDSLDREMNVTMAALQHLTRALVGGGLFLAPPQVFSQYLVY